MTNNPPNSPLKPSNKNNLLTRLTSFARRPSTLIMGGMLLMLGITTYCGINYFVCQKLSPLLSKELSKLVEREVKIGKVESFSFNKISVGRSYILTTETDTDYAEAAKIVISFNPLPIFIGRPLIIDITIKKSNFFIEQNKTGEWVKFSRNKEKLELNFPINIDAKIRLKDADIMVHPYGFKKSLSLKVDGKTDYNYKSNDNQQFSYAFEVNLLNSEINIEGKTNINSWKTQVQLQVYKLELSELVSWISDLPIIIKNGQLNSNLKFYFPSLEEIEKITGLGVFNISTIEANIKYLKTPLKVDLGLDFQEKTVKLQKTEISIGKLIAKITGRINWDQGYNVNIDINPVSLKDLLAIVPLKLPLELKGEIQGKFRLNGEIKNPILTGTIKNTKLLLIDQVIIKTFTSNFKANLYHFILEKVRIIPAAGGEIIARAKVDPGVLKETKKRKKTDWKKIPFFLAFNVKLPTEELVIPYFQKKQNINLGHITAQGIITGTLGNPLGKIEWQSPNLIHNSKEQISGKGRILLSGIEISLQETILRSAEGHVTIHGLGSLKDKKWKIALKANTFSLSPFLMITCSVITCSEQVTRQSVTLTKSNVKLSGKLDNFHLIKINGQGNLTIDVDGGTIAVSSRLANDNINSVVSISGIYLNPYISNLAVPTKVTESYFNLSGSLEKLLGNSTLNIDHLQAKGNLQLTIDGSPVNATIDLGNGILQTVVKSCQISFDKIFPDLFVNAKLIRSSFDLALNLNSVFTSPKNLIFNSLKANVKAQFVVENSLVNIAGKLKNGQVNGSVHLGELYLNKLVATLPVTAKVIGGKIKFSSQLIPLLSTKPDVSSVELIANIQLSTAQGNINTTTQLYNNQWTTNINVSNLNTALISEKIIPQAFLTKISNLTAEIKFSGSIEDFLAGKKIIPVQVNNIVVRADGQILNAQGNLQLSNLLSNPDISNLNLSVNVSSNLYQLPLTELVSIIPPDRKFLFGELSVEGQGEFTGKFLGKNLLTSPTYPGNLQLLGNLKFTNFVFNDQVFEEILTGTIKATFREKIALNLEGKDDKINAVFTPCTKKNCLAPYVPASFELRQTAGEQSPILVQGILEGNRLTTKIEVLPLKLARISLGREYGVPSYLSGSVSSQLEIDTSTLEGRGTLTIHKPKLGFIEGRQLTAKVQYKNNVVFLHNASLKLGKSDYNVQGSLDLQSLVLQGKLTVNDGRVEDLLTALNVTNLERFLDVIKLQPPEYNYTTAEAIPPESVGDAQETIAGQVNLLGVIDQKIRQLAALRKAGGIPSELDIRGRFDANVALGGTLLDPTFNLKFMGNKWEWHPQQPFPDIVPPLGLVVLDEQFIPINSVKVQAKSVNGVIAVKYAQIRLKETLFALQGDFSSQNIDSEWRVQRLSVDTVGNFVKLPVDIGGFVNVSGTLSGTPTQPEIQGQFAFLTGAFQGRSLRKNLPGRFSYQDGRFRLATTDASFVYLAINIPFPITPENDIFNIEAKLGTDALELVSVLTGEQVILIGGEGQVNAQVQGRINLFNGLTVNDLNAQGKVLLSEAIFKSAALPEPLTISGEINLDDQAMKISQLKGTFAQSNLIIAGVLPLFESQAQVENPLTVAIEKGIIDLEGLYSGEIEGSIFVTGNALKPSVSGVVRLADGQVFIPETPKIATGLPNVALTQSSKTHPQVFFSQENVSFVPKLRDFRVIIQNLSVQTLPLFQFQFGGDLIVNGSLNNLTSLKPQGNITLNRGLINFLETRFFLERRNLNQIVFYPDKGLLNPDLDLQLRTIVSEVPETSKDLRAADTTEIPDDSLNKVQRIDINLALKGSLNQLIPSFDKDKSESCLIKHLLQPIRIETTWSEEELTLLENCLTLLAEQSQENLDEQLLSNPVINLTSSPPQSQGQIVRLLGKQLFVLAESLQGQSTEQLIQFGIVQLALSMVFQTLIYDMESTISETIRSTDFRIVPFLETIYEVEDKGFIKFSYDYGLNEFRVRYEKQF
ncbi:translocation/assembly module TamB domain-containing protein [cyanobacterium endosymbiont of Epithemia turgida]|uniref:translocation/assembly module TamB domain-containing protein n=1 Tax=cyanobacterium endosymbiont of Epithemia turgida TaxID=718217 RepID=UPI0005C48DB6|nr:translocation/assembly module TamB domain-containing protein [cyanobacterium endosymbiont of Epithemia turgida]